MAPSTNFLTVPRKNASRLARQDWTETRPARQTAPSQGTVLAPRGEPQGRFFWGSELQRLTQDLGLHRLATKHSLEIADPLLKLTNSRSSDDIVVGLYGRGATLQHPPLPGEELRRRNAGAPRHVGYREAWLHGLFDEADLLRNRPSPATLNRRDHLNPWSTGTWIGAHSHTHRTTPMPYRAMPPVRSKRGALQGRRPNVRMRSPAIVNIRIISPLIHQVLTPFCFCSIFSGSPVLINITSN